MLYVLLSCVCYDLSLVRAWTAIEPELAAVVRLRSFLALLVV